jgi:hypothetical protein
MIGKPGDRIVVESEKVGSPAREGTILEVIESKASTRYRVHWDAGHETTFLPYAGSARVVSAPSAERAAPAEPAPTGRRRSG